MGTVAIQTQCCLKTDDSDLDDEDVAHQDGAALQIVDALRVSSRPANAAGKPSAPPFATRAPSEASTIFVP